MEIHYKKSISISFIAFGVIFVLFYFILDDKSLARIGLPLFLIIYGYLTLTRPYFIMNDNSIEVLAVLGPAKKTYTFDSYQNLEIQKNKIFLNQKGKREKLAISKWLVEKRDWALMVQKIID